MKCSDKGASYNNPPPTDLVTNLISMYEIKDLKTKGATAELLVEYLEAF